MVVFNRVASATEERREDTISEKNREKAEGPMNERKEKKKRIGLLEALL